MTRAYWPGWNGDAVRHVLHHMRPADAEEAFARLPGDDPDQLYLQLLCLRETAPWFETVWKPDLMGRPVAFGCITLTSPGVGAVWMVATPEMRLADFADWAERINGLLPETLVGAGLHRVEAHVMVRHRAAKRFMLECGMAFEGPEHRLGRQGEDFERWVALKEWFVGAAGEPETVEEED